MSDPTEHTTTRLPALRMAGLGALASVSVAVLGGVIGAVMGGSARDAVLALAPMLVAIPLTTLMLHALGPRPAPAWAAPVLGGTVVRALSAFTLGIAVYMIAGPDRYVFFLTLVSALVAVLVIDVALTVSMINAHEPRPQRGAIAEGA